MNDLIKHSQPTSEQLNSLRKLTHILYALFAFTWLSGGVTILVAIIINYIKFEDALGTVYETHFRWQRKTFWLALFWACIGGLLMIVFVGFVVLGILSIWLIYRIAKGWLYLNDGRAIGPIPPSYQQ